MTEKTRDDYMREYEEQEVKHEALFRTLTVPGDDTRGSYTQRSLQAQWVKSREHRDGSEAYAITGTTGWTAGCSKEVYDLLTEGKPYILETIRASQITGWIIDGAWHSRKTDEDLQEDHAKWLAKWEQEKLESLEKNREDWTRREESLPDWLKVRLATFHEKGGEKFDLEGWGYELVVCELAVEYAALGDVIVGKDVFEVGPFESEAIKTIANEQGTSGNQHGVALALAKAHLAEPGVSLAGTVSALSPLTGDAFYDKK